MDQYRKSDKLLGVWVTHEQQTKSSYYDHGLGKFVATAVPTHTTKIIGVVPIEVGERTWKSESKKAYVKIAGLMIGWTRDAGKTFITDEDQIREKGMLNLQDILSEYPVTAHNT